MYLIDNKLYRDEWFAFETDRLRLAVLRKSAYLKVTDYYVRNRDFHKVWSQTHDDEYFTARIQKAYLRSDSDGFFNDHIVPFYIFDKNDTSTILGRISLFNIVRGGMQSAIVGYHLDEKAVGHGYMLEALKEVTMFAFDYLKLHRVEAYIMPHNVRSLNLINRAGFAEDGLRKSYMHINGNWEDHKAFVYINPNSEDAKNS